MDIEELGKVRGTPFPFGLTFVPLEVAGSLASEVTGDTITDFARLCEDLQASFAFVPGESPDAGRLCAALLERGVSPMWVVSGPFWPLVERLGTLQGLRRTLTHPEEFGADIDHGLEQLLDRLPEAQELGARAVVLAEDLAGAQGPLVAPDFVIGELMPRYSRFVQRANQLGMPSIFHSDGDVRLLVPSMMRAGFAGVHVGGGLTVDAYVQVVQVARTYGLVVLGGFITAELTSATRAEALGGLVGRLARGEGVLLADDGGITTAVELERLMIALGVARAV